LKERQPDVAIVSPRLVSGPADGFALVRNIHSLRLRTRVIMLLDSRDRDVIVDAFRFGAHGVVFRDEPLKILTKCIHAVHSGQIWANSLYVGYLIEALKRAMPLATRDFSAAQRLTKRERDLATLIAEGMTNRDIANRLGLTENTVRNYLQHVFDKVGCSTRAELMLYWIYRSQQVPGAGLAESEELDAEK
jgi:DNA-binding NarL/FixJ family response regulator